MMALLDWVVRPSVVLMIGLLAVGLLRRQPAAVRHWILAGAIGFAALQPVMTMVLPSWHMPARTSGRLALPIAVTTAGARTEVSFEVMAPKVKPTQPGFNWLRAAAGLWLAGSTIALMVIAAAMIWLTGLGRSASSAGTEWIAALSVVQARLGIRRRVRIAITRHPAMLVTWGAIAPTILLPADADSWAADRKELVVAHEVAHVMRHDWLIQLLAETVRAIYWFNPLFWIACAQLRHESECACDDIVLETGISGTAYASHLVDLARSFSVHGRTWLPAPSIARPSTLERRVRAMLNSQLNRRPISAFARVALCGIFLTIALPIAAVSSGSAVPSGSLRDPQGRVLPGAVVRLSAIADESFQETQSDRAGAFQFPEVPEGEYMLSARVPGFLTARQRVRVSNANAPLNMTLQVGTLRETVSVSGRRGGPDELSRWTERVEPKSGTPRCGTTEVGGNLKPPTKVTDVRPRYRKEWIDNNLEGSILMMALIGVDGKVRSVEVVSGGEPGLEEEALAAVGQWEFSPTWLNCQPIEVRMYVTVSFKIDQ